jgi:N-ethylmaleimide reductase
MEEADARGCNSELPGRGLVERAAGHYNERRSAAMTERLYAPTKLADLDLKNRVVMAPMTRSRAIGNVPNALMAEYYAQRSEAGLIITEGTAPSPDAVGYARIPGLYDAAQVAGWRVITDAVHARGAKIFVQLMHSGRIGHPHNLPAGGRIVAPSDIAAPGTMHTDAEGPLPFPVPIEMTEADIERALGEFVTSSALAIEAGFDGVELHGANGYLIDQFLNATSNHREDGWGGSVEGRVRFALEVARRVAERVGAGRVGIRLSPYGVFNGMSADAETDAVYLRLVAGLSQLGIAYVHLIDHSSMGAPPVPEALTRGLRAAFRGRVILSGGYDAARAEADLEAGRGDLIAFGRPFLANPRLVTRLRAGLPLAQLDPATLYTPGERGYTDYPLDPA